MNFLSFDIGTTNCKCRLYTEEGEVLETHSAEYGFLKIGGETYVDIAGIWAHVKSMIAAVAKAHEIHSLCISSFGESFVLTDEEDRILFNPMLYTDPRGEREAEEIARRFSKERLFFATGVLPQSMYSVSKLLWIKNNLPKVFSRAKKIMLICDYIGYLLTGERVIDYALAARTGIFNINDFTFDEELLRAFCIPVAYFSRPMPTGSIVGRVKEELKEELGLRGDCTLALGSHDQICSALGAGALRAGDAVDGMGTVECITALFKERPSDISMGNQGYVCVPYALNGLYCTYMFNYSCGSLVNWYKKKIMHGYTVGKGSFYDDIESRMKDEPSSVLLLPHFAGAGTPYAEIGATGGLFNLTVNTDDADIYRAILEGCAMEMRLNAETAKQYGITVERAVATGGGANSRKWLQIKADIQGIPVRSLQSSEGGLCGCAILQAVAMGTAKDAEEAAKIFVRYGESILPRADRNRYEENYRKYKKLYQMIKEIN